MNSNKLQDIIRDKSFISGFVLTGILIVILKFAQVDLRFLKVLLILVFFSALFLIRVRKYYALALGIFSLTSLIFLFYSLFKNFSVFQDIQEWDFFAFYLYGKLGVSGLDFYKPENIAGIFSSLKPAFEIGSGFYAEVINVGFPYPPPTMILFAPLGFLNMGSANILWKLLVLIVQIIDIIILIRLFKGNFSLGIGTLTIIVLTVIFPGTLGTVVCSQTNFFLLFFILLTYKNLDNWKSGLFLALAIMIKPLAAIWCLYIIVNRKWDALISLICSGILIVLTSGLLFGFDNFLSYINSPPTDRISAFQYVEAINQSLNATLSRLGTTFGMDSAKTGISYLVLFISLFLTLLTSIASYQIGKINKKLSFLIFIPLSLLIYPGSLAHYSVFLIPVFFEIQNAKINLVFQRFIVTFIFLFFLYNIFSNNASFIINLITLISLIVYSFYSSIGPGYNKVRNKSIISGSIDIRE